MTNLTVTLDDEVLHQAAAYAAERNTTVASLVEDYLAHLARRRSQDAAAVAAELAALFKAHARPIGTTSWTRDELHER